MSERIRILFVDDERQVLDGLMRLFRPQRHLWEVRTAPSGAAALAELAHAPADVVVSDMRMPSMDGAELLAQVREHHPAAVRIMLSGQSDREGAIVRAGPCHHFLAKPCDHDRLVALVNRALQLRHDLNDAVLTARMATHPALPVLPRLWQAMVDELAAAEPSMTRLADLVGQEPATAARLLRVVNSAAFGLERTIDALPEAVAILGIEALRALVLAVHVHDACAGGCPEELERLWSHCLRTAQLARAISQAESCSPAACEAAFTAGLLHDCGRLLLRAGFPEASAASEQAAEAHGDIIAAELAAGGPRHDLAGAWLLMRWGLPDPVVEAAAWHHRPDQLGAFGFTPLDACHIADALSGGDEPDAGLVARLGGDVRLAVWRGLAAQAGRS